jgi:hypothetical protein
MAAKLKFCTQCGEPPQSELIVPPPRVINMRPAVSEPAPVAAASPYQEYLNSSTYSGQSSTGGSTSAFTPGVITGMVLGIGVVLVSIFVFFKVSNVATTDVLVKMTLVGQSCSDISWGYSDIPGGNVNLSVDGVNVGTATYDSYGITSATGCQFGTTVYGVKENGSSYSVISGNAIRGTITETKDQLSADGWTFNLTLGSN